MNPNPLVCLERVWRRHPGPPPVDALRPSSFEIDRGELVAIMGPSGSGKSTLLHLLGLLDHPSGGRYLLDGVDVTSLGDGARSGLRGRRIGFVFQSFHLLAHRSALENVLLASTYNGTDRKRRAERGAAALRRVGLSHRIHAPVTTLSGGEQQRVAIARAVADPPELLLCDEPTGNLDSTTAAAVLDLLIELNAEGLTVVLVTHDADVAARTQRLFKVTDGQVTEAR